MNVEGWIVTSYRFVFGRRMCYRLNRLLYDCSLRGLGVLNYESNRLSGETRFLASRLQGKGKCTVFDVGANVGKYSSEVLDLNPAALVYAFEPHPATFAKLKANLDRPNFHPNNFAVGDRPGSLSLYDYADRDGSSHASLYKEVIEGIHKARSVEHKVEVIALGGFLETNGIDKIDLLKVDTEGNELNVLKGLAGYLQNGAIRAIHLEFNEMNVASRSYFKDFWELLPNYAFYRMLPDGLAPIREYSPVFCEIFAYQNIVAILKGEMEGRHARGYY